MPEIIPDRDTIKLFYIDAIPPERKNDFFSNSTSHVVTLMFIETFRSAFGNFDESNKKFKVVFFESHKRAVAKYAETKYLTPAWLIQEFNKLLQEQPELKTGVNYNPTIITITDSRPREKFVRNLVMIYQGRFEWSDGTSDAFKGWIRSSNPIGTELDPKTIMNCWEFIFYVAIKSEILDPTPILAAYSSQNIAAKLYETLNDYSKSKGTGGIKKWPQKDTDLNKCLKLGDLIFIPSSNFATAEPLHHVAAVVEIGSDIKVVELWRHLTPDYRDTDSRMKGQLATMARISLLEDIIPTYGGGAFSYMSLVP